MNFDHDLGAISTGLQTLDVSSTPPGGGVAGQLSIIGTGGVIYPSGTTAQRPAVPVNGTGRYSSTLNLMEFYQNNLWVSMSGGSVTSVNITGSTGITPSGGPITTSGSITLTLGTELQGLSALSANGIVTRTTAGTYASRTITGTASNITVTNGDGVAGNPTVNLVAAGTPQTNFFGQITTDAFGRVTATTAASSGNITTALSYTPVNKAGDTMTGALNMGSFNITNVAAPVAGTDAANKNYVDSATTGLSWKNAVRAGTTVTGTLASAYANGSSIDGVTLVTGNRILIKNQATASENGIYTVNATGAPTRALDMDTSAEFPNATVYISQGTTQADTGWTQVNDNITVGTTAISFIQFSGSNTYTAGTGLTLTGNSFSISAPVTTALGGTGLTTTGTSNQVLGVNSGATGLEYKTIAAGTAISVVQAAGSITINNTGVTSIVAGSGVSISGATGAVTISNTGVTSVGLTGSTGIAVGGTSPITTTGTFTLTLSSDLQALTSFNTGIGIPVRTATNTWSLRTVTGTTNQIAVTNGDGVAGNPTIAIAANIILPGTAALTMPIGTNAQQPAAAIGQLRYDSTSNRVTWSNASTWQNIGTGDGSVTSVGLSLPSIFTVSNSPVTTTGTLTATLVSQTANTVFAAPNGSAGAPTFRTLVNADMPYKLYAENAVTPVAPSATGTNSQAFGSGAVASLAGSKAFAAGNFSTAGDAQSGLYVSRNVTSSATVTELFIDDVGARLVLPNNSVWTFDILVAARRTDATGGGAGYKISGVVRKDTTAASITFIGTPAKQVLGETTSSMDCNVITDTTNGSINISVKGVAAQTYRWVATVITSEITN